MLFFDLSSSFGQVIPAALYYPNVLRFLCFVYIEVITLPI